MAPRAPDGPPRASPELPSVLQELWDLSWRKRGNLVLILCGSYMGFMERQVLGKKSPLFGRRTAQILLQPFSYREAAQFHPDWSIEDRARAYFICGGVPFYLRFFVARDSIMTNIAQNFLNEFAALHREPEFLLREELREVENYYGILIAIASGHTTPAAIAANTGLNERTLYYYLQNLVELGYVWRRYPLSGARSSKRKVRFVIEDPLLRFWFRFVYPNTSYISQAGPQRAFRDLVRPQLEAYFGTCFERLCREALAHLYQNEGVVSQFEVGEYWDKTVQIDVVGRRGDDRIDIGECRWGPVRSLKQLSAELQQKMRSFPNKQNATLQGRIFLRRKPPKATVPADMRCHGLRDLYE